MLEDRSEDIKGEKKREEKTKPSRELIREKVLEKLKDVSKPDSRFHLNFSQFIPDFEGSNECANKLRDMEIYSKAEVIFITPDNCLEKLREFCIADHKIIIMPTYGIKRGFLRLDRSKVGKGKEEFASTLDGFERFGSPISLSLIRSNKVDLVVTGASVVNSCGVRMGKGHGYFDLEWGILTKIGAANENTPVVTIIHDLQYVEDLDIPVTPHDSIVDYIITPTRAIKVEKKYKKPMGMDWSMLDEKYIESIPPLAELKCRYYTEKK